VKVNIPEKYIQMPKPLSEYKDIQIHGQPTPAKSIFWSDAISASDPYIDFSDVTVSIIFPTPNTPIDKFSSNPDGGGMSNEGRVAHILSLPPLNTDIPNSNSNFSTPNMMIHELTHAGLDMGDYESTGIWSHVGAGKFDYLGWDKFIAGFMSDQQVYCVDPNQTSTRLIFPSAAKGPYKKLVVVPISASKVLVVESIRSAGYKYKLPKEFQGALVYTVDVSVTAHGQGTYILRGNRRTDKVLRNDEWLIDAPLHEGESLISENLKITILESGKFGDVIKVEKF